MNNLIYGNHDRAKLAAGVEEIVRKDVGSATALPYRLLDEATGAATVGSVLVDIGHALGSGATTPLLVVEFDLPGTIPARRALGSTSPLARRSSPATPATAARLNGAKDLAKRADKVLRSEAEMGSIKVKVARAFKLTPADGGSLLILGTLPRLTSMGMGATTDAREILDIAAAVAAAL